jgi:hypothetical protein
MEAMQATCVTKERSNLERKNRMTGRRWVGAAGRLPALASFSSSTWTAVNTTCGRRWIVNLLNGVGTVVSRDAANGERFQMMFVKLIIHSLISSLFFFKMADLRLSRTVTE